MWKVLLNDLPPPHGLVVIFPRGCYGSMLDKSPRIFRESPAGFRCFLLSLVVLAQFPQTFCRANQTQNRLAEALFHSMPSFARFIPVSATNGVPCICLDRLEIFGKFAHGLAEHGIRFVMAAKVLEASSRNSISVATMEPPTQCGGILESLFEITSPVGDPCSTNRKVRVAWETLQPLLHERVRLVEALEIKQKSQRRNGEQSRIRIGSVHFVPNQPCALLVSGPELLYRVVDSFSKVSLEFGTACRGLGT